jgi:8-oxo-dGTP pyrophosphatase MutT (NUDIX family)
MTETALVVFGDVVDSQLDGPASARWLRSLAAELDDVYAETRRAPFGFTQGDELQGLLRPDADPLEAVFRASLRRDRPPGMRWAIAAGEVEPGEGPATQRTGPAFVAARELIEAARRRRDRLVVRSGDPETDERLDEVAPVLGTLLAELSDRQREVAYLLLVERLRQSDAAVRLDVARPTVSVAAERAHVRDLDRLRRATLALLRDGIERQVVAEPAR